MEKLNFIFITHDKYGVDSEEKLVDLIQYLVEKTHESDSFLVNAQSALLKAICFYLVYECDPDNHNFSYVKKLLSYGKPEPDEKETILDLMMKNVQKKYPKSKAAHYYSIFKDTHNSRLTEKTIKACEETLQLLDVPGFIETMVKELGEIWRKKAEAASKCGHVYEVDTKGMKEIMDAESASEEFLQECKDIAEKYRKKDFEKDKLLRAIEVLENPFVQGNEDLAAAFEMAKALMQEKLESKKYNNGWISTKDDLPKEGEQVTVFVNGAEEPANIHYGITNEQREKMKNGELPDPVEVLGDWSTAKRSSILKAGDVHGNNAVPYSWSGPGPFEWFGQDINFWRPVSPPLADD